MDGKRNGIFGDDFPNVGIERGTTSSSSCSSSSSSSSSFNERKSYCNAGHWKFEGILSESSSSSELSDSSSSDEEDEYVYQRDCEMRKEAIKDLVCQEINRIRPVTNIYAARYIVDLMALYFNEYDFIRPRMILDFLSRKNIDLSKYFTLGEMMLMVQKSKKLEVFELERAVLFG